MSFALPALLGAVGGTLGNAGQVVSTVIQQIGKFIRFAILRIWRALKLIAHYIVMFARYASKYLAMMYREFMKDPVRFMQFTGSMAILIYYGLI